MKSYAFLFGLSLLLLPACRKSSPASVSTTTEDASKIAEDLRALELEEKRLKHEIEIERLALEKENLRLEREALEGRSQLLNEDFLALEKERTRLAEERTRTAEENARMAEIDQKIAEERARLTEQMRKPVTAPNTNGQLQPLSVANVDYDFSVFHNRLSSQGSWFSVPQYGYVWRPSCWNQNNWRPYTQGHWVYTDYGWTWVSDEPFGWATYHYGRWVLLNKTGWCWVPGSTWGPAWVCWRNNSSHIGWAPLPPESLHWSGRDWSTDYGNSCGLSPRAFCFVTTSHFGSNISRFACTPNESIRFHSQTSYCGGYTFEQNRIICRAIDYNVACRWIGQTIPRYHCQLNTTLPSGLDPLRHVARRGDRLQFHAPDFRAPWNSALRPARLDRAIENDQPVRSNSFDHALQEKFMRSRDAERQVADRTMNEAISQKVIRRIGLREKIAVQRGELTTALGQTMAKNEAVTPSAAPSEKVPTMDTGLRELSRDAATKESPAPAEVLADQAKLPDIETPPATTGENVDAPSSEPLTNRGAQGGGLREVTREQQGGSGQAPQRGRDPITESIKETQQRAMLHEQERNRVLGESALERARLQKEQQELEAQKANQKMSDAADHAAETAAQQQVLQKEQEELLKEKLRLEQEAAAIIQREAAMKGQQQEAMKDQREAAMREQQEAAIKEQQDAAMKEQQEAAMKEQQEAAMKEQQQAAMREQQEASIKSQQEAAMREQQDAAREQQEAAREAAMREQQERAREQQEAVMREQQERAREQQEAAREAAMREQQERAREQQEAAREAAMREQQERAREQQEAAMREQQERAREQQEAAREAAMREQQERARQQ